MHSSPKIFYYCGGSDQVDLCELMCGHVKALAQAGLDAYAVFLRRSNIAMQSELGARAIDPQRFFTLRSPENDYFVLPDEMKERLLAMPGKKVVLGRNIFDGLYYQAEEPLRQYPSAEVTGVLVFSEHSRRHWELLLPEKPVIQIKPPAAKRAPVLRPLGSRKRRILIGPAKVRRHSLIFFHLLHARGALGLNKIKEYEIILVDEKNKSGGAALLDDSILMVSLDSDPGSPHFSRQAREAGCMVAGYNPWDRSPAFDYSCEPGDFVGLINFTEQLMDDFLSAVNSLRVDLAAAPLTEPDLFDPAEVVTAWRRIFQSGR